MMSPAGDAMGETSDPIRMGAELREARERLGWSLADVAANLRIRQVYLQALEEGRAGDLPGVTYAVGFLRAYAKLLGLNPDDMSRRLRADIGAARKTELEFPAPVPDRGVPAGVVVLLGVLLAIGAYVGWYRISGDRSAPPPVQAVPDRLATLPDPNAAAPAKPPGKHDPASGAAVTSVSPGGVSPGSAAAAVPPPGPPAGPSRGTSGPMAMAGPPGAGASTIGAAAAPAVSPGANNSHLVVRARADTWVQVRERQGPVLLNRVLRAGETWPVPPQAPGQPPLLLTTGNAGGTELLVDGVVAPPIGTTGTVKRDLPLDVGLIREGKLQALNAAGKTPGAPHTQSIQQ